MPSPLFSVIVPIYRVEKYLDVCIKSILEQSCTDFELILVDDGSPDRCGEIADGYAARDSRVRVCHKKNEGLVHARNSGLALASGDYIVNVDGDDYMAEGALRCLEENIKSTHAEVYCFGHSREMSGKTVNMPILFKAGVYSADEERARVYSRAVYDADKKFYTFGVCPSVWSQAVKRELFEKYRLKVDGSLAIGEDFATTLPILLNARSIAFVDKLLYCYRVLDGSMSHSYNKNELRFAALMLKYFSEELNLDMYGLRGQLAAYTAELLYNHLCGCARNSANFNEYTEHLRHTDKIVFDFARRCPMRIDDPRAAIIIAAVKCGAWRLIWNTARRTG